MIYFGVDYYPEHWPEERWEEDIKLMVEARVNVVRLAEFAWSKLEPQDGQFEFDWLDRAISALHQQNIRVVLGTPTASPPPWLMKGHAEIFLVRADGIRRTYGHRRGYCPNNKQFHEFSLRIVRMMVEKYQAHPAVIGWQIDNELGERCYCAVCSHSFQEWLKNRYESIETMNQRWGTVFWSHGYRGWSEIPLPLNSGRSHNPGLVLDFYRFSSDSYCAYQKLQQDILREKCPDHFITHNMMGLNYGLINYFDLAQDLDLVSWDNYPRMQWTFGQEPDASKVALNHDTMRALKAKNFWVMEQQAGPGGWEIVSEPLRPGELKSWAYQAIAHGADGLVFFRWRTARYGTEQHWHGILDHHGQPGRRYREFQELGGELDKLGKTLGGALIKAKVAILLSYDSRFAFEIQANHPEFSYTELIQDLYRPLYNRNISTDIVPPGRDLSRYQVVFVPALYILPGEVAENLARFVARGGILVITARSGVRDECNAVVNEMLPGALSALCGVNVEENISLPQREENQVKFKDPEITTIPITVNRWFDILAPTSAEIIATYESDFFKGKPAITMNLFGDGKAIYLGSFGDDMFYDIVVNWVLKLAKLKPAFECTDRVEISERWQGDHPLFFVINHGGDQRAMSLKNNYEDLISGNQCHGQLGLKPYEVLLLREL